MVSEVFPNLAESEGMTTVAVEPQHGVISSHARRAAISGTDRSAATTRVPSDRCAVRAWRESSFNPRQFIRTQLPRCSAHSETVFECFRYPATMRRLRRVGVDSCACVVRVAHVGSAA